MQEHTGIQKAATSSGNVLEGLNPSNTIVSIYKYSYPYTEVRVSGQYVQEVHEYLYYYLIRSLFKKICQQLVRIKILNTYLLVYKFDYI